MARGVRIELSGEVLFDFGRWEIHPDAELTLWPVAEIIQQYPRAKVAITGYMDAKRADAHNLHLSERRAAAVKTWLAHQGVDGK